MNGIPHVYLGHSKDGIHWEVEREKVPFTDEKGEPMLPHYAYDPRLVKVEDTYYIIWCTDFYGAAIGMGKTKDFKTFTRVENPFIPFNRNAVLFPRRVGGMYKLLSRPSDSGHTPFGDIFLSESPDMVYWGKHRHVMGRSRAGKRIRRWRHTPARNRERSLRTIRRRAFCLQEKERRSDFPAD